ncbi:hypothetical protein ACTFIZ_007956 [Dictyostelium cf. discoideum]
MIIIPTLAHAQKDKLSIPSLLNEKDVMQSVNACLRRHPPELSTNRAKSEPIVTAKGPLFVSVKNFKSAPKGECFEAKPVLTEKQLQGWMLRQTGKCGGVNWGNLTKDQRRKNMK